MNKNQKGFAYILVTIIIGIIAVVGYLVINQSKPQPSSPSLSPTPVPDVTTNWKTYINSVLQINFKYPGNWIIEEVENKTIVLLSAPNTKYEEPGHNVVEGTEIRFDISPYKYAGNITDLLTKPGEIPESDITIVSSEQEFFGEREAVKTVSEGLTGKVTSFQIPKEDKVYSIGIHTSDSRHQTIIDQILSTFKFISKEIGYRGYNLNGKRFTLAFPSTCSDKSYDDNNIKIECKVQNFNLSINPQAGGRGTSVAPEISKLILGKREWEKRSFNAKDSNFATYAYVDSETKDYYLIEVNYFPESKESQRFFENILSTFKWVNES